MWKPDHGAERWSAPPSALNLQPEDVHLWRVALLREPWQFQESYGLLSADESARASRFYFARDRNRFLAQMSEKSARGI